MHSSVYGACAHLFCYSWSLMHCYICGAKFIRRPLSYQPKKVFAPWQGNPTRIPKHFTGYGYEEPPAFQNKPHHIATRWPSTCMHARTHIRMYTHTHNTCQCIAHTVLKTCTDHGLVQHVHIRSFTLKQNE